MSGVRTPLTIKELYQLFREKDPWENWRTAYLNEVEYFKALSDTELRTPQNQERLWRARSVSGIGPGESVNTDGAYNDSDIVDALLSLKNSQWSGEASKRAKAIQGEYDKILSMVSPKHSPQRPQAKLSRLFTVLLPEQFHTGYSWDSYRKIAELLLGTRKVPSCESAVLSRDRIRTILGKEEDLSEHIQRSTFCWWLYENYNAIINGEDPVKDEQAEDDQGAVELPKLSVWPITKQLKGISAISGYTETLRAVVAASRGGATPDDIVQTMQSDLGFEKHSPASCRQVFSRVRRLEFLENRNGLWYPSDDGERLVEEDPPDVLVEKYLTQFFGLGHLLKLLIDKGPMPRKKIFEHLQNLYPRWTSTMMPNSLIVWGHSLGLISVEDQRGVAITDYGKMWVNRLPEKLETPPPNEPGTDILDTGLRITDPADTPTSPWPDTSQMLAAFQQDGQLRTFIFSPDQIESLHLAWHSQSKKRFVILSGLSGTGKTAILYHYARVFCENMGLDVGRHRATIAVSPDWRDPSGLIGYFNALHADPTFQIEPALRLVLDAANDPKSPYFLILDEMNLARVERYFAPFLSAMETGEKLTLHAHDEPVNGVPPTISWPKNLFIGGTVNMDETTHPFSDKVLDRAFTMEFWEVALDQYLDRRAGQNGGKRHEAFESFLKELNELLKGIRRHFGYRTVGEILDFLDMADAYGNGDNDKFWKLADQAVFSKVLPRLRGMETPILRSTLESILDLCRGQKLPRCINKVEEMQQQLTASGVTKFWS